MALKRVTLKDIADACGLSRNTVSKVFNAHASVPEATKKAVLKKAQELGYGRLPDSSSEDEPRIERSIALLAQHNLMGHNFGAYFITSFTDQICRSGYTVKIYEVSPEEIEERRLPPHFEAGKTSGILCIELFDKAYQNMVASLGIPCIFVDGYVGSNHTLLNCDFISMENYAAIFALMDKLFENGATRIGFVGDRDHCNSFFERWVGYANSLMVRGLKYDDSISILDADSASYGDGAWYVDKLRRMPFIPDAFVCANDYIAIHLMAALKKLGKRIPQDVMVTGFDCSPDAALVEPSLTTVSIKTAEIGRLSADVLDNRIRYPERPFRRVSVLSTPVFAESTDRKK